MSIRKIIQLDQYSFEIRMGSYTQPELSIWVFDEKFLGCFNFNKIGDKWIFVNKYSDFIKINDQLLIHSMYQFLLERNIIQEIDSEIHLTESFLLTLL